MALAARAEARFRRERADGLKTKMNRKIQSLAMIIEESRKWQNAHRDLEAFDSGSELRQKVQDATLQEIELAMRRILEAALELRTITVY